MSRKIKIGRPCRCPKKEILKYLYVQKRLSLQDIAKLFGVSREAIRYWLNHYRIALRDRIYAVKTKNQKEKIDLAKLKKELKEKFGLEINSNNKRIKKKSNRTFLRK